MDTPKPFGTVALSLSGGGSRAAAFHLGTISYLARADLMQDVAILSTVSGGSFVGATYALALAEAPADQTYERTFADYYRGFYDLLRDAKLVVWAFEQLAGDRIRIPSGRRTLITALAEAYDQHLTHQARFDALWRHDIHLKEIVFNATEFHGGLAFRFWRSEAKARSGSPRVSVPEEYARTLRLADIVAASSCIPVGCEPLVFPDDFLPPEGRPQLWAAIRDELRANGDVDAVPLMDGGVYDNQGIESVLDAVRPPAETAATTFSARRLAASQRDRHQAYGNLGLFIISDTPLQCENLYAVPPAQRPGRITLDGVSRAAWALLFACVASMIAILSHALGDAEARADLLVDPNNWFAYGIPFVLTVLIVVGLIRARRLVRDAFVQVPQLGEQAWDYMRHLTLRQALSMVMLRLSSTWAMTASVYFNRIRFLGYSVVDLIPDLKRRVIRHEIFDVIAQEDAARLPDDLAPSVGMVEIARRACRLQTKLWFDNPDELRDAVACGQFTMCYNLLAYAHLEHEEPHDAAMAATLARVRVDWATLQRDPYAFVEVPLTAAAGVAAQAASVGR